jgi:6-phosphogluconolactonase
VDVTPEVAIFEDPDAVAQAAARAIHDTAHEAVAAHGRFTVALAGGRTPEATYRRLAALPYRETFPWARTFVFFGDERWVRPDHPDSNARMARAALLDHVPVPAGQVFPIRDTEDDPEAAAAAYALRLGEVFGIHRGELPRFDLILLGLGVDGHTASLFPGSPVLREIFRPVVAVHASAAAIPQRVTLTLPVLNAAARVLFLVTGAEKARAVRAVLQERAGWPAALVQPSCGRLLWMLDRAAAAGLAR